MCCSLLYCFQPSSVVSQCCTLLASNTLSQFLSHLRHSCVNMKTNSVSSMWKCDPFRVRCKKVAQALQDQIAGDGRTMLLMKFSFTGDIRAKLELFERSIHQLEHKAGAKTIIFLVMSTKIGKMMFFHSCFYFCEILRLADLKKIHGLEREV